MSSDSEDDFYGNMTERLQKEKDKIIEDKTGTLNLFDDSAELDEIVKNNKLPSKPTKKQTRKDFEDTPGCSASDLPEVAVGSPSKSPAKRVTRSRAKRKGATTTTDEETSAAVPNTNKRKKTNTTRRPQGTHDEGDESGSIFGDIVAPRNRGRGRSRGKGRARTPRRRNRGSGWYWASRDADLLDLPLGSDDDEDDGSIDEDDEESGSIFGNIVATRTSRGRRSRGRGLTRAQRCRNHSHGHFWAPRGANFLDILQLMFPQRNRGIQSWDPTIPTYSVGNTEDYDDQSHNQPLFSNTNKEKEKPVDVVNLEEDDNNEELSVKVYWQSSEFFKFSIRKFQKLTQIFDYFAKKENVTQDKLLFMYNERILSPDDTPDAIEYNIVKFIDGGIVTQGVIDQLNKDKIVKNGITLKFQAQNLKKPIEVTIGEDDKLSVAMIKCSEVLEQPLEKLKFIFDGDSISGKSTARELEFEGGECIDVRIIS